MGRRLSDEVRAHRIVGEVHVREMKGVGKCKLCKEAIPVGQKSLRYNEVVYGRKQESGICMDCAARLWQHAEEFLGKISAAIQEHVETRPSPVEEEPEVSLAAETAPPVSVVEPVTFVPASQPDVFTPTVVDLAAEVRRSKKSLMEEFFGGTLQPGSDNDS
jgi:hypothetical protein